jgi:hypothetical protein
MRFSRPSPSMVISLIALFVSLGGVSYGVATGSIDGREIKNGSLTGRDVRNGSLDGDRELDRGSVGGSSIDESSLRTVGRAKRAESADRARRAGSADSSARATSAGRADSAADADKLGGLPPSAFASGVSLWAVVDGTQPVPALLRSSGGIAVQRNPSWARGGAYKVTFPRNVRGCVYGVTAGQVDLAAGRQRLSFRVAAEPDGASPNTVDVFLEDVIPNVNDDGTFGLTVLC